MVLSVELNQLEGSTGPIPAEIIQEVNTHMVCRVTDYVKMHAQHKHAGACRVNGRLDAKKSLPLLFGKMIELVKPVLSFRFFDHAGSGTVRNVPAAAASAATSCTGLPNQPPALRPAYSCDYAAQHGREAE